MFHPKEHELKLEDGFDFCRSTLHELDTIQKRAEELREDVSLYSVRSIHMEIMLAKP